MSIPSVICIAVFDSLMMRIDSARVGNSAIGLGAGPSSRASPEGFGRAPGSTQKSSASRPSSFIRSFTRVHSVCHSSSIGTSVPISHHLLPTGAGGCSGVPGGRSTGGRSPGPGAPGFSCTPTRWPSSPCVSPRRRGIFSRPRRIGIGRYSQGAVKPSVVLTVGSPVSVAVSTVCVSVFSVGTGRTTSPVPEPFAVAKMS